MKSQALSRARLCQFRSGCVKSRLASQTKRLVESNKRRKTRRGIPIAPSAPVHAEESHARHRDLSNLHRVSLRRSLAGGFGVAVDGASAAMLRVGCAVSHARGSVSALWGVGARGTRWGTKGAGFRSFHFCGTQRGKGRATLRVAAKGDLSGRHTNWQSVTVRYGRGDASPTLRVTARFGSGPSVCCQQRARDPVHVRMVSAGARPRRVCGRPRVGGRLTAFSGSAALAHTLLKPSFDCGVPKIRH